MIDKATKRLQILRVLKRSGVSLPALLRVHFVLIRSVLEYCWPVWHSFLSVQLSDIIESFQKRALRIICPALHYHEALEISGRTTLHTGREALCAKTFEKIKSPDRAFSTLSLKLEHLHMTERFKKSFFPAMCLNAHGL